MARSKKGRKRSKAAVWLERVSLGALMSVVAFVVERRLLKVIRRRGEEKKESRDASLS